MDLRTTTLPRALHRPNLILGGERDLVLVTLLISVTLIAMGQTVISTVVGALLMVFGQACLRFMAQSDPNMSRVYLRSLKYRLYYPPRSTPWRP